MSDIDTDIKCDRCPARAAKRIEFPSGHDLIVCEHHCRKFAAKIEVTILITDLELTETPVPVG